MSNDTSNDNGYGRAFENAARSIHLQIEGDGYGLPYEQYPPEHQEMMHRLVNACLSGFFGTWTQVSKLEWCDLPEGTMAAISFPGTSIKPQTVIRCKNEGQASNGGGMVLAGGSAWDAIYDWNGKMNVLFVPPPAWALFEEEGDI